MVLLVLYGASGLTHRSQTRALLALAVEEHWGLSPLPALEVAPRGKPYFPGLEGRAFNLSHSGDLALAALDEFPVGVDIQTIQPHRPGLPQKIFSPGELAWLESGENYWARFTQLWALKECRAKESGLGLTRPISSIRIPLPQGDEPMLLDGLWFRTYCGKGWRAALCGQTLPPESIRWIPVSRFSSPHP